MLKSSFLAEHLECKDQYWEQCSEDEDKQEGTKLQWTLKNSAGFSPQFQVFRPSGGRTEPGGNEPHDELPLMCRACHGVLSNDTGQTPPSPIRLVSRALIPESNF